MIITPTSLEASAAVVAIVSGLYALVRHIRATVQFKKDRERQAILDRAKEEINRVKEELEEKIKHVEIEFEAQKLNISKDLDYFKQTYNNEIKVLGEKIENLRDDLSTQHGQLVALLTRLVDTK